MVTATEVRERPMLFQREMVQAILARRKTMTRRIIKPRHLEGIELDDAGRFSFMHSPTCGGGCDYSCASSGEVYAGHIGWTPWGSNPRSWGRLWVRETWTQTVTSKSLACVAYRADSAARFMLCDNGGEGDPVGLGKKTKPWLTDDTLWRSSTSMPRWASRITLEITDIRVERLQQITEADAQAEGAQRPNLSPTEIDDVSVHPLTGYYRDGFRNLWESINGAGAWERNDFVWVVSFRRVEN